MLQGYVPQNIAAGKHAEAPAQHDHGDNPPGKFVAGVPHGHNPQNTIHQHRTDDGFLGRHNQGKQGHTYKSKAKTGYGSKKTSYKYNRQGYGNT